MIPTIVSSLMYTRGRRALQITLPSLRSFWNEWELRVLVCVSLTLQVILIFFGSRRKYMCRIWIRILLWCAYLMADWLATVALGVISNNLGDVLLEPGKCDESEAARIELTAFWAPFLLLHLGGPDTITAYSLEDNELWLRHFLGLGVQTGVVFYILILVRTGTHLTVMSVMIFIAGIIKYGERTWVLRCASSDELRESMLTSPDPGPDYAKFMQEYTLKDLEGFHVVADEVIEAQVTVNLNNSLENNTIPDAMELVAAYDLIQNFKRLLVNLILGFDDRHNSQSLFRDITFSKAFKVVEIELSFIYDMLYTKATLVYSLKGCVFRFTTILLTAIVLGLFSASAAHRDRFETVDLCSAAAAAHRVGYETVDLVITYLLLSGAIGLEIYAILLLISSDWTDLWLSKHKRTFIHRAITWVQLPKPPRWSNVMPQYSLLSYCLGEKPAFLQEIQKLFHLHKLIGRHRYKMLEKIPDGLKESIFRYCQEKLRHYGEKSNKDTDLEVVSNFQGSKVLRKYDLESLCWSTEGEFDQSILIWHIATDLCYWDDFHSLKSEEARNTIPSDCRISKHISGYMLYLLVICPFMLPIGIGMIRFRDTCADAIKFFKERAAIRGAEIINSSEACSMLFKVNTAIPSSKVKGDKSKSVLFEACRLATMLQKMSDKQRKWKMISEIWVEMLAYAASQCRGNYHAQQLRRGGEFLTHVWLLMAHFGLTEQFQISRGHARAKLIVK